jgi:hypothetical protein
MGRNLRIAGKWAMTVIAAAACTVSALRTKEFLASIEGWPLPLRLPPAPADGPGVALEFVGIALLEIPTLALVFLANLAGVLSPFLVLWIAVRLVRAWIGRRGVPGQVEHRKEQEDA